MRTETKALILLLLLPPLTGELLSASLPPLEFLNPISIFFTVLIYGCGTLLIREAKARWRMQWSVILLAMAYGILEEGLMVKSFFNPCWIDMGSLSGYAMFLGTQWPWVIFLIIFHATVSTLIPLTIVAMLFPQLENKPLLGKKGTALALAAVAFVTILGMAVFGSAGSDQPFFPNPLLLIASFIAVAVLSWLAIKFSASRITSTGKLLPPIAFGLFAFAFQMVNLLLPNQFAQAGINPIATILSQLAIAAAGIAFAYSQLLNKGATKKHLTAFVFGTILFYAIIFDPIVDLSGVPFMLATGLTALALSIVWRNRVLKS